MRSHASHELAQALGGTGADSEGWSGGIWNTFIMSVQRDISLCTIFLLLAKRLNDAKTHAYGCFCNKK
jgi:hypothetical protein